MFVWGRVGPRSAAKLLLSPAMDSMEVSRVHGVGRLLLNPQTILPALHAPSAMRNIQSANIIEERPA